MARARYYSNRRTYPHEKNMGSYELHAQNDAHAIAWFAVETFQDLGLRVSEARAIFDAKDVKTLGDLESKFRTLITDFIRKPESQREGFFRRIAKDADRDTQVVFLGLVLLGAVRAKELLELRDRYRMTLAPGCGNRITMANAYEFASEVESLFYYDWPKEVFVDAGVFDEYPDDEYPEDE